MSRDEALQDVETRRRQLEAHMLASTPYLQRAEREVKRRITYLYLALGALFLTIAGFFLHSISPFSPASLVLFAVTSLLALVNIVLFIHTKAGMSRLNEAWLLPEEREILELLRAQYQQILTRATHSADRVDPA